MSPVPGPQNRTADYFGSVLFARRAVVLVVLGLVGAGLAGGCGTHRDATSFCARVRRGHAAFDATDWAGASAAVGVFNRIAANAPASLAPDLKTVGTYMYTLFRNPSSVTKEKDPVLFERNAAAFRRVDRYLHETCGVTIPKVAKFG